MDDKTRRDLHLCVDRVLPRDMERRRRLLIEPAPERPGGRPRTRLAIIGVKRWENGRTLSVGFLDGDSRVQEKVVRYAEEWGPHANVKFEFGDRSDADIRISFLGPGSWSYLGTDARAIEDPDQPTMNFGWLYPETAEDEYRRVVVHEFGHALGAIHEHQNPGALIPWNKQAVYDYYMGPPNGWTEEQVDINLFKLYDETTTQFTEFDTESIMLYPIPREFVTDDAYAVGWNRTLSETDKEYMRFTYPGARPEYPKLEIDGESVRGEIGAHGEQDVFEFAVAAPGSYQVGTEGTSDVILELAGPNDPEVVLAEDDDSGPGLNAQIVVDLTPGKYYVRVGHYWPKGTGEYRLRVDSGS